MKTWKRALTLLLVLTMVVGMFTMAASAIYPEGDTYTLRLVDNVSSYSSAKNTVKEITGLKKGDFVTVPSVDFSMKGYTMIGWSVKPVDDDTCTYDDLYPSEMWDVNRYFNITDDTMTLYAVWSKDCEWPWWPWPDHPNHPDHPDCKDTFYVYVDYNRNRANDIDRLVVKKGESLKLDEPTRKGYDFVGWYIGSKEYKGTPLYESCTITAKWKEHDECPDIWGHKHKIVYTDGVKNEVVFKDVVKYAYHMDKTPTIKDPTRDGYRFAGWSPSVSTYATECITYEAMWLPVNVPTLMTSEHVAYLKGYGGGKIKPESTITRAEVATMLYRLMDSASVKYYYTTSNSFSDVYRNDWYNEAVSTLANAGVITGYGAGKFNPNAPITRAELVVMLSRLTNTGYHGKCRFVDVPSNYWAYDEIALAQSEGWIKGYGAGYFYPEANITRAEVAAILNRMLDRDDCVLKDTKHYVDNPVNAWYYDDILEASIAH